MATRRQTPSEPERTRRPRAKTPEERERQLIALAVDQAEAMMEAGTAPAQIVTHYLKLGSSTEMLAQEFKREEMKLLKIKAEAYASQKRVEELYTEAMSAFKRYSGEPDPED